MAVSKKDMTVFSCARCRKSLKRFYVRNAFKALGRNGTRYNCPHCKLLYDSKGILPILYQSVFPTVAILLLIWLWGSDDPFDLEAAITFMSFPFFYLYLYGAFRPLTPILYKFKDRI